jgi:squalene-hopene/tetraprenyl-beta-curcumene cyclase
MNAKRIGILASAFAAANLLAAGEVPAGEANRWDAQSATRYMDERATAWFDFRSADRGQGADKVSCLSCHTLLPYALARPALHRLAREPRPAAFNERVLGQVKERVAHWDQLDTPRYKLFYDFSEEKKAESWGTEAVLNALVLARDDRERGLREPSPLTKVAFRRLWQTQCSDGPSKGSWNWLNFGLEPWESDGGRYYGTALAAVAVGTAPGYAAGKDDAKLRDGVERLRAYLRAHLGEQSLHNRLFALWASSVLPGLLTANEQKQIVDEVLAKQEAGAWSLASLGFKATGKDAARDAEPDGYATGLALHVLQLAGLKKDNASIAKGLDWLRAHQEKTGAWASRSVNKRRNPATHEGRFMSDAATAFAVLALDHP